MTRAIMRALREERGSILAFLPGQGEITRVASRLAESRLPDDVDVAPLYGALDRGEQDRAIAPAPPGRRKIVLATSIAETSLTIEGVRIVIDSGLARVQRFEPDLGLSRLETVRASRASVDQRRGRAGRTEPGVCYRLWDEPQTASLPAFAAPEILDADLSGLALDLAAWGVSDPAQLKWLDPPPAPAWKEAVALDRELGALDDDGRLTDMGRAMRALPLAPQLGANGGRGGASRRGRSAPPNSPCCSPSAASAAPTPTFRIGSSACAAKTPSARATRCASRRNGRGRRWRRLADRPHPNPPPLARERERTRRFLSRIADR